MSPYAILGGVLLAVLLILGGYKAGAAVERSGWQRVQNEELMAANAEIQKLNASARAAERKNAADLAAIGDSHAVEKLRLEERRRTDVAAAHSGALRLRVTVPGKACGGGVPDAGTRPAGSEPPTETVELPSAVTGSLYALANDADAQAAELNSCWAVVRADRAKS